MTGLLDLVPKTFKANNNKIIRGGSNRTNKIVINLSKNNKFRNSMHMPNIEAKREFIFLIFNTKKAFNHLKQVFIKASTL